MFVVQVRSPVEFKERLRQKKKGGGRVRKGEGKQHLSLLSNALFSLPGDKEFYSLCQEIELVCEHSVL